MALRLSGVLSAVGQTQRHSRKPTFRTRASTVRMAFSVAAGEAPSTFKVIDSHLHVWASPQEVTQHFFPFWPMSILPYFKPQKFKFLIIITSNVSDTGFCQFFCGKHLIITMIVCCFLKITLIHQTLKCIILCRNLDLAPPN